MLNPILKIGHKPKNRSTGYGRIYEGESVILEGSESNG